MKTYFYLYFLNYVSVNALAEFEQVPAQPPEHPGQAHPDTHVTWQLLAQAAEQFNPHPPPQALLQAVPQECVQSLIHCAEQF